MRGGKSVFLLDFSASAVAMDPFSAAFLGLLCGLFSEKAYELLGTLVSDLVERSKRLFQDGAKADSDSTDAQNDVQDHTDSNG